MKLKLIDTIFLSIMTALLMIGGHQMYVIGKVEGFKNGFLKSYWIFMLLILVMAIYQVRRNKSAKQEKEESGKSEKDKIKELSRKGKKR